MGTVHVIGYPSSAAAYCVGVEQAPQALRAAGLADALRSRGHEVADHGDLTTRWWRPDHRSPLAQNLDDEGAGLVELRDATAAVLGSIEPGDRLLVLGGSCTVALGTCAAARMAGFDPRLVYVDRHLDLNVPTSTQEGSLSWMGMAHAIGVDGASQPLAEIAGPVPLLAPTALSYLGVDPQRETTDFELEQLTRHRPHVTDQAALVADPPGAASQARRALGEGPFLVHLDVDVLDFQHAPLAENVNGRNSGPDLDQLQQSLHPLWTDPDCLGLSIGQLVPAHAASAPGTLERFVEAVVPPATGAPSAMPP